MSLDALIAGAAKARGKRPWFFDDPDVERVMNVVMALAMELSVSRQRIDTLERLLESKGVLERAEIDAYAPEPQAESERQAQLREYLMRVLRIVLQDTQSSEAEAGMDTIIEELANI